MIGNWKVYVSGVFMLLMCIIYIIPDLFYSLENYSKTIEIYENSRTDSILKRRRFAERLEYELVLVMKSGNEYKFAEQYSKYWKKLSDKNNYGKKYTFYTTRSHYLNPSQVEIENEVIYYISTLNKYKYSILLLTSVLIVVSVIDLIKYILKNNTK